MQALTRGPAPACLGGFQHGRDPWDEVNKVAIWIELDQMQGGRCAYCETAIAQPACHIEHFRQRSRYPQGTFEWSNMFGSCNRSTTCGKHKDRVPVYPPESLLKPDVDDPMAYLLISDGVAVPRAELDGPARHRAEETRRIFNLNDEALVWQRHAHAVGYRDQAEEFLALADEYPEAEWLPLLEEEMRKVAHLPFVSAIRQVLWPR